MFERPTALTSPGDHIAALVGDIDGSPDIARFHQLAARILERVVHESGSSVVTSTAEDVLDAGRGVCQDQPHVFVAAALDDRGAAPVSGLRFGAASERISVTFQVQQ